MKINEIVINDKNKMLDDMLVSEISERIYKCYEHYSVITDNWTKQNAYITPARCEIIIENLNVLLSSLEHCFREKSEVRRIANEMIEYFKKLD